jgi:hypothetical protein
MMTFPTPHIGHSRYGLYFTRLDCQSNAKPSEKDHDLSGIRTRDLWSSSQYTQPLHHLGRDVITHPIIRPSISDEQHGFVGGRSTVASLM